MSLKQLTQTCGNIGLSETDLVEVQIYRLLVPFDNEFGRIFVSVKGQLAKEAADWVHELASELLDGTETGAHR